MALTVPVPPTVTLGGAPKVMVWSHAAVAKAASSPWVEPAMFSATVRKWYCVPQSRPCDRRGHWRIRRGRRQRALHGVGRAAIARRQPEFEPHGGVGAVAAHVAVERSTGGRDGGGGGGPRARRQGAQAMAVHQRPVHVVELEHERRFGCGHLLGAPVGVVAKCAAGDRGREVVARGATQTVDKIDDAIALDALVGMSVARDHHVGTPRRVRPLHVRRRAMAAVGRVGRVMVVNDVPGRCRGGQLLLQPLRLDRRAARVRPAPRRWS